MTFWDHSRSLDSLLHMRLSPQLCRLPVGLADSISHFVAIASVLAVLVVILIAVFDLRSTADIAHARLPYIFLIYIAGGFVWYAVRRKQARGVGG